MNRGLKSITKPFSNKINIGGIDYLYFGGTAYLGIPQNDNFLELYMEGLRKYGLNNGTSRTNNIQLGIYDDAEKVASVRFKAEDALITSSGYLAAQLTVHALSKLGEVIYAPSTHPALWLTKQSFNSSSFTAWCKQIVEVINSSEQQDWVLISNSMNNLFPEIYDFDFVEEINPAKKVTFILDDSHGIGINNKGLGCFGSLPKKPNIEWVVVASMAKALGVDAGLVLGSAAIIGKLKQTNIFVGASPPAAAGLYAFMHAETIYNSAWNKLQTNIELFSSQLNPSWKFETSFPAFFLDDVDLADRLLEHEILISSFPYPNTTSEPINRIVLSSWHNFDDVERLLSFIR